MKCDNCSGPATEFYRLDYDGKRDHTPHIWFRKYCIHCSYLVEYNVFYDAISPEMYIVLNILES